MLSTPVRAIPTVAVRRTFVDRDGCTALIPLTQRLAAAPPAGVEVRRSPSSTEIPARYLAAHGAPGVAAWLTRTRERVRRAAGRAWGVGDLRIEFSLVTELRVGATHALHADNERPDGRGGWEPNHTPNRYCTGMVYLNTSGVDYHGGAIYFPRVGVTVPPATGTLVLLDCSHAHEHGVYPVTAGVRYALSLWMVRASIPHEDWPY